jgi:hypothetical protein
MEETKVWLGTDGVIRIDHGFMANVTSVVASDVISQLKKLVIDKAPLLVKSSGQLLIEDEVLFFDLPKYYCHISALAIFTPSHSAREHAFNYMRTMSNIKFPVQAFTCEKIALEWLLEYVELEPNY